MATKSVLVSFVLVVILGFVVAELNNDRVVVTSRYIEGISRWKQIRQDQLIDENTPVFLNILLKQRNLEKLDQVFWAANDPSSLTYGIFATKQQIDEIVAPSSEVFDAVRSWLNSEASSLQILEGADYLHVFTTVGQASKLFHTKFGHFYHERSESFSIGNLLEASIPSELSQHIDFITGLGPQFNYASKARLAPKARATLGDSSTVVVTPDVIASYYNLQPITTTNSFNQSIAAFADFYSAAALARFEKHFNLSAANITEVGKDCLLHGCDQYESDLDIQYITSIAKGTPTIFYNTNKGWILEWGQAINNQTSPAVIHSMSYGWTEDEQCAVDPHNCKVLNTTNNVYVNRSEIELQKLAARGITILIAAGDDGAPEYGGSGGNCPMDSSIYCPAGGCKHNSTSCASVLISDNMGNTCQFPMGISGDGCSVVLSAKKLVMKELKAWATANAACSVDIEQDAAFNPWVYSNCSCPSLTFGDYGNFTISEYSYDRANGAPFTPDYPASSAFVLSVGATQFSGSGSSIDGEIVCSVQTQAIITGGGGFSNIIPTPSWQQASVSNWMNNYASGIPAGYYNSAGRAYPDITLVGHNFDVFYSNNQTNLNECPCLSGIFDGTSASTPSSAGLLSSINEVLASENLGPLGFLNPLLYTLTDGSLNDITIGNNNCNRAYCCLYGYSAVPGFDPASGLGSINWTTLVKAVVNARQTAKDRRQAAL